MQLRMFGGFGLLDHRADRLKVPLRRGQALLAYLALKEEHIESRESIVDMLWPGRFKEQAQSSLRQVLYELRKKSPDDASIIVASRGEVSIGPAIDECDVWAFESCIASTDPVDAERALQLYRGPFLDGPGIGAETFQQWAAIQRARLEGNLERAVLNAATIFCGKGMDERACRLLEDLVRLVPLCTQAMQQLMALDAGHGRFADALRKYERYASHLRLEFDLAPADELRDAYETLKSAPVRNPRFSAPKKKEAYAGHEPWRQTAGNAPVIAVLPFRHMANKEAGNALAAAMSEDITLMLSGCRWFRVLSRSATHSCAAHEQFLLKDFVRRTGADYLVYGAVTERGDRWSVTIELADAASGVINWAKRYDASNDDILSWAREVCPLIVAAIDPALAESERSFSNKPALSATGSVAAYRHLVNGYRHFYSGDWTAALSAFRCATEQDETYAHAHAMMAVTIYFDAQIHRNEHWREQMRDAEHRARRALEIDPSEAKACNILGQLLDWQGHHDESFAYLQRAVTLNPSFAWASTGHSYHAVMTGKFAAAKSYIQTALRLRVGDSGLGLCLPAKALADLHLGNSEAALQTAHWAMRLQPKFWLGRQVLAACLSASGDHSGAKKITACLQQDYGDISSTEFAGWFPYMRSDINMPILDTLKRFGWR